MKLYIIDFNLLKQITVKDDINRILHILNSICIADNYVVIPITRGERVKDNVCYNGILRLDRTVLNKLKFTSAANLDNYLKDAAKAYERHYKKQSTRVIIFAADKRIVQSATGAEVQARFFNPHNKAFIAELEAEVGIFYEKEKLEIQKLYEGINQKRDIQAHIQYWQKVAGLIGQQLIIQHDMLALKILKQLCEKLLAKEISFPYLKKFQQEYSKKLELIARYTIKDYSHYFTIQYGIIVDLAQANQLPIDPIDQRASLNRMAEILSQRKMILLRRLAVIEIDGLTETKLVQLQADLQQLTEELHRIASQKITLVEDIKSKQAKYNNGIQKAICNNDKLKYLWRIIENSGPEQTDRVRQLLITVLEKLAPIYINSLILDRHGNHPLHLACYLGDLELIQWLLQRMADISKATDEGSYVIHKAAYCGDIRVVTELLRYPINLDVQDQYGRTALYLAVERGHIELVELLLAKKTSPYLKEFQQGDTVLHCAARRGHLAIIKILIKYMGNCAQHNDLEHTAAHEAILSNQIEIAQILLRQIDIDNISKEEFIDAILATRGISSAVVNLSLDEQKIILEYKLRIKNLIEDDGKLEQSYNYFISEKNLGSQKLQKYTYLFNSYSPVNHAIYLGDATLYRRPRTWGEDLSAAEIDYQLIQKELTSISHEIKKLEKQIQLLKGGYSQRDLLTGQERKLTIRQASRQELTYIFGNAKEAEKIRALSTDEKMSRLVELEHTIELLSKQREQQVQEGAFCEQIIKRITDGNKLANLILELHGYVGEYFVEYQQKIRQRYILAQHTEKKSRQDLTLREQELLSIIARKDEQIRKLQEQIKQYQQQSRQVEENQKKPPIPTACIRKYAAHTAPTTEQHGRQQLLAEIRTFNKKQLEATKQGQKVKEGIEESTKKIEEWRESKRMLTF